MPRSSRARRFSMDPRYAAYYYSDDEGGTRLPQWVLFGALLGGGILAYRAGLLRPAVQRALVLGSRWRPGVIQDITHGVHMWARATRGEPFFRSLRSLSGYVAASVRERMATRTVRPLLLQSTLGELRRVTGQLRDEWTRQLGAQGLPLEEIRRRVERGLEAVSTLAREAVLERFTLSREVQEALLRSAGVRLATVEDILRLDPQKYPQFRRLRLLLSAYGIKSDPARGAWVYVDPHLFVLPSGELVDMRHLAGRAAAWIRTLERHFAIPFVNFNPLSLYHIDKLLKLERQPVVHLFERGEIQPYLTGTTERIGRALYVGGRVYSLEEIPRSVEELRGRIMNEGRRGILVPGQEFINLEYLRSMAGLPTRIYEPYTEGARGLMARAMRMAGIGFQDVYRWTDVEIGLLGRDVAMEAGMTSIDEIYGRMAEAGWKVLRPWKSAVVPPETQRYLQQQWIYLNAADLNSIASVLEQLFAGRRNLTRVTPLTLIPYIGVARMNVATGAMGFGLPIEHTGSALDVFYNMFLRRAFILGGLAFLWHYLNYEAENITGVRPEYVVADAYVRATEVLSGLGEKVGLPRLVKRLGQLLPGGEQIAELPGIHQLTLWMGKTREEMEEYWERGEEPVRKGRWWPLGNTPFTGGRIQAWIPSWYRRLKSKWQYTDVLYGSEEEYFAYAPFPTPRFPAAPLRRYILDPYHFERRHYYDRPYLLTGDIPELVEFPLIGPLLTFVSRLIKPQLRMHPEMWQLIESGIIPQDEGAKEVYVSPEELERGRPAPPSRYLAGEPRYPTPLIMPPPPPEPEAARAAAARKGARGTEEAAGGLWGLEVTGAPHAWREVPRGRDVVVAVIDTGVNRSHPDLKGQVLEGYNVIEDNRDVTDRAGHGTHVAGIIAALGNDGRGAVGAAFPAVKILPIKALSDEGLGRPEDIEKAIEYAVRWRGPHGERVSVINLSLGAPVLSEQYAKAIKRAHEAGIVVVAAAGNEALWHSSSPAIWPEAISVAAAEEKERRRGRRVIEKAPYSNYGIGVDITAPGTDILSTVPGRRRGEGRYEEMSGTSMAASFVAAAAALLKAVRPDLTPAEVHYLLTHTARDLGPPGEDQLYGAGLLDIGTAVAVAADLDEKELEKLTVQGLIHERNIEAQRFLLLNYMRNKLGNEVVGLINRHIVDQYGREVVQPGSLKDVLQRFWSNVAEMLGFYGFTMEAVTGTQEELRRDRELRMADARAISSFRRQFWRAEVGGLGGEVNEILRRFVGRRERWEWMYSPIRNTMPSWLPGPEYIVDYHHGDPYTKISYGEILLPGGGYEALYHVPAAEIIKHDPLLREMERLGLINRFEFYDPFNRFRVLAHVSPWSEEYRYYSKLMSQMKLDARQREEVKRLREQVRQMKKPLRLYPYRFRYQDLKTEVVTVERVIDQNTILVREYPEHPVRFAGIHVTMAKDDKASKEAMKWLQEHLRPGTRIRISYDPEHKFAEDTYQTIRAVVWLGRLNVGRAMLLKGWAHEKEDDWSAPAVYTRFSWQERLIGRLWEAFAHLDTPIHTKLLQVRSAYEDWVRREVYGKNFQRWERPWSDYILPTYQSFITRSPFLAIASGMVLGALFGHARRSRYGTVIGAAVGGLLVGAGSLYRAGYELFTGEKWIPARRRKEWEICVPPDTLVQVDYGILRPIGEIVVGDEVLTHTGRRCKVLDVVRNPIDAVDPDKKLYRVEIAGSPVPIRATYNHPFLVMRPVRCHRNVSYQLCKPSSNKKVCRGCRRKHRDAYQLEWVPAAELKRGDYVAFPIPRLEPLEYLDLTKYVTIPHKVCNGLVFSLQYNSRAKRYIVHPQSKPIPAIIRLTPEFYTIIGYYLAEGTTEGNHVSFSFHISESEYRKELMRCIMNVFGLDSVEETRGSVGSVRVTSNLLASLLANLCGRRSEEKRIDPVLLRTTEDNLLALLRAYINGDGNGGRRQINITSTSLQLLTQISNILAMLGIGCGMCVNLKDRITDFGGYKSRCKQSYKLYIGSYARRRLEGTKESKEIGEGPARAWFVDGNYIFYRINKVETEPYDGEVIDIKVAEDHSFCVINATLHNCEYIDILKYLKYRRLFEYEAKKAKQEEGFDILAYLDGLRREKEARQARIEELLEAKRLLYVNDNRVDLDELVRKYRIVLLPEEEEEKKGGRRERLSRRIRRSINAELELLRQAPPDRTPELPPHARKAMEYYRLMKQTMYGYEPGEPLENFLAALPKKERRYFQYFLKMPQEEYEKLKKVVPRWLLYGLAPMRGEEPPPKPSLEEYFEHHFLPDESWPGWRPDVSLQDVKVKLVQHEAMDTAEFDIWPEDVARARRSPAPAPKAFKPTEHGRRLQERLRRLLSGLGVDDLDVMVEPADRDLFIEVDLEYDPRDEIAQLINADPAVLLRD